jgi:hypothetical protein
MPETAQAAIEDALDELRAHVTPQVSATPKDAA